jgi:hypothetical protein
VKKVTISGTYRSDEEARNAYRMFVGKPDRQPTVRKFDDAERKH